MITAMSDDNTAIHCIIGCNDTIIMIMLILFCYGSHCISLFSYDYNDSMIFGYLIIMARNNDFFNGGGFAGYDANNGKISKKNKKHADNNSNIFGSAQVNWTTSKPIWMPDDASNVTNAFNNDDKNADMPVKRPETPFSPPISSNANNVSNAVPSVPVKPFNRISVNQRNPSRNMSAPSMYSGVGISNGNPIPDAKKFNGGARIQAGGKFDIGHAIQRLFIMLFFLPIILTIMPLVNAFVFNDDGDDYSYAKDSSSEGKDYSDRTLVYSGTPKGFTDKAKTIQDGHLGLYDLILYSTGEKNAYGYDGIVRNPKESLNGTLKPDASNDDKDKILMETADEPAATAVSVPESNGNGLRHDAGITSLGLRTGDDIQVFFDKYGVYKADVNVTTSDDINDEQHECFYARNMLVSDWKTKCMDTGIVNPAVNHVSFTFELIANEKNYYTGNAYDNGFKYCYSYNAKENDGCKGIDRDGSRNFSFRLEIDLDSLKSISDTYSEGQGVSSLKANQGATGENTVIVSEIDSSRYYAGFVHEINYHDYKSHGL